MKQLRDALLCSKLTVISYDEVRACATSRLQELGVWHAWSYDIVWEWQAY